MSSLKRKDDKRAAEARFAALMAKHNAARTARDAPVPASLLALPEQLARADSQNLTSARSVARRHRTAWATGIAAVAAIAITFVALTVNGPAAVAATPSPLVFSDASSTRHVVADAVDRLSADVGVKEPVRSVRSVSWGIVIEDDELRGPVIPQIVSLDWAEDLSGHSRIIEGHTSPDANGAVGRVVPTDTVTSDLSFAPGEFGVPSVEPPSEDAAGVRRMLEQFGMPPEPTSGQVVQAMVSAMGLWTLSDEQHAVVLELLAAVGGVKSLGQSVDRLGRDVIGLQAESAIEGMVDIVLVSADTGRIVGVEAQRTSADGPVPSGTVVSYQLWDNEQKETR